MIFQESVGIDIQPDKVAFVYVKGSFKGTKLSGYAVHELDNTLSINDKISKIVDFYGIFVEETNATSPQIFVGLPRELFFSREIIFPQAVKENISNTLRYEMEKYIPLANEEYYFDKQLHSENKLLNQIKVFLVVAKKKELGPYLELRNKFKHGLSGIEPGATAYVNCFLNEKKHRRENDYAIVRLGQRNTEINLIRNNVISASKIISIATEKVEDQLSIFNDELKAMGRHASEDQTPMYVYFWGTNIDTTALQDHRRNANFKFIEWKETNIPSMEFATAFGLALKGHQDMPMSVNLLPDRMRRKQSNMALYIMFALFGLTLLLGLLWVGGHLIQQNMLSERLDAELAHLKTEIKSVNQISDDLTTYEDRINFLNSIQRNNIPSTEILKELSIIIPDTAWIKTINILNNEIKIQGEAQSASELITIIERSEYFKDVKFLSTITKKKNGMESYNIGFEIAK